MLRDKFPEYSKFNAKREILFIHVFVVLQKAEISKEIKISYSYVTSDIGDASFLI